MAQKALPWKYRMQPRLQRLIVFLGLCVTFGTAVWASDIGNSNPRALLAAGSATGGVPGGSGASADGPVICPEKVDRSKVAEKVSCVKGCVYVIYPPSKTGEDAPVYIVPGSDKSKCVVFTCGADECVRVNDAVGKDLASAIRG